MKTHTPKRRRERTKFEGFLFSKGVEWQVLAQTARMSRTTLWEISRGANPTDKTKMRILLALATLIGPVSERDLW